MSTVAFTGRGSKLQYQTSPSPVTWATIGQLQKFSFSGMKTTLDDVTNLDSPGSYKEHLPVEIDAGDVSFEGIANYALASNEQATMATLLENMTLGTYQILLSDGVTTLTFSGYVTEFVPVVVETTKALTFSGKISISGAVTIVT